jgi:uncharacterized protein (TIGR00255 family)
MSLKSMTGFASGKGELAPFSWGWELRSVNAKGLDIRLRVPDWLDGLEAALREELGKSVTRGNVSLSLRLSRSEDTGGQLTVNRAVLDAVLKSLEEVESRAAASGVTLAPTSGADILSVRGVMEVATSEDDHKPLTEKLKSDFGGLVSAFVQMRADEGAALAGVLRGQLDTVETLIGDAQDHVNARREAVTNTLKTNLARVMDNTDGADPDRVAQELALIAVKSDVTEELDRLTAHVAAARALLDKGGPIGRKFDFLMQEFNREANTLCSKSQNSGLTAVGLELKAVIDQMREQVQNVE